MISQDVLYLLVSLLRCFLPCLLVSFLMSCACSSAFSSNLRQTHRVSMLSWSVHALLLQATGCRHHTRQHLDQRSFVHYILKVYITCCTDVPQTAKKKKNKQTKTNRVFPASWQTPLVKCVEGMHQHVTL